MSTWEMPYGCSLVFVVSQGRQSTITDNDDHVTPTASVPLGGTRPHDEESTSRDRWRLAGAEAEHVQAARHPLAAPG